MDKAKSKAKVYRRKTRSNRRHERRALDLFGEFTEKNLGFLHRHSLKVQNQKVQELLQIDKLEEEEWDKFLPTAYSVHSQDILKTDVFSTGIQEFDMMFASKGITSGEVLEFCGQPQSGKSLMIHTILSNVLKQHKDIEVIYFDSKNVFQAPAFMELLTNGGNSRDDAMSILSRVHLVQVKTMYDLLHGLRQLLDPQRACEVYNQDFDMNKVGFVVINTITIPYYHASPPMILSKKITFELHKAIFQLKKHYRAAFLIGNLGLHKYKISESDKGDDVSSCSSTKSFKSNVPVESIKAALDEYWPEILDHRFVITAINNKCDILGYVEIPRQITMVESRGEKTGKSIIVRITDMGIV